METDPSNQWVVGSDAAQDRIYVWKLTVGGTPPLTPAATPFVNTPPGDGPRHFAFHPNGVWMYSIQEEGDTIIFWKFNPANGRLTNVQQVSSLPPRFVAPFSPRKSAFPRRPIRLRGEPSERYHLRFLGRPRWQAYSGKPHFNARGLSKNNHHRSLRSVHGVW